MKLLVVGSGWSVSMRLLRKLLESKEVEKVFVAPGNDGMTLDGLELVNISISEHSKLIEFAKDNDIAWSFIGPDDALAAGIVDDFNQVGLKAFGPTRLAAELEWSKDFAKEIMANTAFRQRPMAHSQISRKPRPISKSRGLLSWSRRMVWPLGRVLSLLRRLSKRSKPLMRCFGQ